MLKHNITDKGIVFTSSIYDKDIPFDDWEMTEDCIFYFPLATLVDNGFAEASGNECILPFGSIYQLEDEDRDILSIPQMYDKSLRLKADGMLNSCEFKYILELLTYVPDGDLIPFIRNNNIVFIDGEERLLSESQYLLFEKVDEFNGKSENEKNSTYNFQCFSEIKKLAEQSKCELDSYLRNENVVIPDKLKLGVSPSEGGFRIDPTIDTVDGEKFTSTFNRMHKVQNVYPIQRANGERVRVIINDKQKKELLPIKERHGEFLRGKETEDVIKNPTEYFDPDQFDLSDFYSDRVIKIGVYKPKFFPFISPYKSCWIAGATVETPENGTSKITINDIESLNTLKEEIDKAESLGNITCTYNNAILDVDDAKVLYDLAKEQLSHPKEPVKKDNDKNGHKVLIIEENAEEVGFSVKEGSVQKENRYTLYRDPYLCEEFNLKRHQEEGIAWLQYLYQNKVSGCLMADDMGLGKTLQILYFIDWHSRIYPGHKPYLIVAPVSLLENWESEYNRFFKEPRLKITRLSSKSIPRKFSREAIDKMQSMQIIITNYESLRIAQMNFCAVEFDVVVLDEAQKIKTPGTMVTNAAKALKSNFRVAMTGTPVENSLLDLWCIMDFCVPGLLGNAKDFAAKYQNPLKKEETDLLAVGKEIHDKLGVHFMRRLKTDIADELPEKHEIKEKVDMPELQEKAYKEVVNQYVSGEQPNMLVTIMEMRYISEHPFLYDSTFPEHTDKELIENSARLIATVKFLDEIRKKNEKVIIFAEHKATQKMLQRIIRDRYGIIPRIINGDTPTASSMYMNKGSRQETINRFQAVYGFNAIIMSPIAAGMGLNVTAANNVIHYGRHWNPAKENQATDRAYRIGQTKDVYVYYPMAVSDDFKSFDVTLDELLCRKTALATSTIFPTEMVEVKQDELGQMLFCQSTENINKV